MCENKSEEISNGQYVIFQRKEYKKLHLLSEKSNSVFIGKDKVELSEIIGKKIGSTFKMIPKVGANRCFSLQLCSLNDISQVKESFKVMGSGIDNRTICDDGSSQLLTSNSIEQLRDCGTTPKEIIEQLVENSKTFQIKTGYAQEKYIKKKEKKYFEFISVVHPTIRLLADILYARDVPKSIGIRVDTLSQITTALNFQPDGKYLLVESGFNGIVAATLLNSISEKGRLIHITPGNQNQKQAVLAMNFSGTHMARLVTVRLSTLAELIEKSAYPGQENNCSNIEPKLSLPTEDGYGAFLGNTSESVPSVNGSSVTYIEDAQKLNNVDDEMNISSLPDLRKRKFSTVESNGSELTLKKPRWALEAEIAVETLLKKVDGLMIACKEYPLNILDKLLVYLLPSRPFVVYSLYQEPLISLYLQLKQRHDILYLKITKTWFRPYQILPERSHPAVTITSSSGYILSGLKVVNR